MKKYPPGVKHNGEDGPFVTLRGWECGWESHCRWAKSRRLKTHTHTHFGQNSMSMLIV